MQKVAFLILSLVLPLALSSCAGAPAVSGTWRIAPEGQAEQSDLIVLHPNHDLEIVADSAVPGEPAVKGTWSYDDGLLVLSVRCAECGIVREDPSLQLKVSEVTRDSISGTAGEGGEKVVLKRFRK